MRISWRADDQDAASGGAFHGGLPSISAGRGRRFDHDASSPKLAPTDCALQDWKQAGLRTSSYFRLYPVTLPQREVRLIGKLSDADWASVRVCFKAGFGDA